MDKQACRKHLKSVLAKLNDLEIKNISKGINSNLSLLLQKLKSQNFIQSGDCLGAFSPLPDEFIWYENEEVKTFSLALPHLLSETEMCFVSTPIEQIQQGFSGLKLAHFDGEHVKPKVLLVPGLGFSTQKERIGRGKGFYDRFLASDSNIITIGVASQNQVLNEIPSDEHDKRMDYLITDQKIY